METLKRANAQKEKIMLVEDDHNLRFIIATELRAEGYFVIGAEDGERAAKMIEANGEMFGTFDLVITDLIMPKVNGLQLCERLKKKANHIPILIISSFLTDEIVLALEVLGSPDVLEKPFSVEELLNRVRSILDKGGG